MTPARLPYQDNQFDGATIGWGLRNVPDQPKAVSEAFRVLKPGARFVCLDMTTPGKQPPGARRQIYVPQGRASARIDLWKDKAYKYLPKSTEKFMTKVELAVLLTGNGFKEVGFKTLFFGNICMHWGTKP